MIVIHKINTNIILSLVYAEDACENLFCLHVNIIKSPVATRKIHFTNVKKNYLWHTSLQVLFYLVRTEALHCCFWKLYLCHDNFNTHIIPLQTTQKLSVLVLILPCLQCQLNTESDWLGRLRNFRLQRFLRTGLTNICQSWYLKVSLPLDEDMD